MNPSDQRLFDLALKKQRLQLSSDQLRDRFGLAAHGLAPTLATLDTVGEGLRWLRQRPEIPVALAVAALVARPKTIFRWSRRALLTWQAWRKARALALKFIHSPP